MEIFGGQFRQLVAGNLTKDGDRDGDHHGDHDHDCDHDRDTSSSKGLAMKLPCFTRPV